MTTQAAATRDDVIAANIEVHTRMASTYQTNEPHFRPENRAKVRRVLETLAARAGGGRLLDVGCGTGFAIDLARDLFARIDGVDVTPAMLERVDLSGGHVFVHEARAEALPFADATFDMASSYAFMHHVTDHVAILREVRRVLRPGGLFYVDLEPNKLFWASMNALELRGEQYSDIVMREIESVLHTDDAVEGEFGISAQTFRDAEPIKSVLGGFDPDEFAADARAAGFSAVEVTPEWYLGQGAVLHGQSAADAATIEAYLRRALPATAHLFKYLRFVCVA
ncbi:MAG: methyltransferase domain-containing protein [Candidatus Eremiobacteraeota bacterium]|nr:methyltransferase domain-containing protein [Candidatus Eremiobacteraeota bacterium]